MIPRVSMTQNTLQAEWEGVEEQLLIRKTCTAQGKTPQIDSMIEIQI